ncbi:asparagine synthase [Pseudomonas mucidolens]|uniref:asparagine synthase n=1 Tax=Pseudomonas mucidolens TaxID=46679 RepID=UPI0030DA6277
MNARICGFLDFCGQSNSTHLRQMGERPAVTQAAELWFTQQPGLSCGLAATRVHPAARAQTATHWVIACEGWLEQQDTGRQPQALVDSPGAGLVAILEGGVEQFAQLNGEFALAALNLCSQKGYLIRDRWGTKPLYYSWIGPLLVFAADLRSLTGHPSLSVQLDRDQLAAYFAYDAVPTPFSLLKNVRKLNPGHALVIDFKRGSAQEVSYWHLADGLNEPAEHLDEQTARQSLHELFAQAVQRRQRRYPDAGVFLTSGYDSSLIAALLQRESAAPINTFCVGFNMPSLDETARAEAIAARLGCRHTTLLCQSEDVLRLTAELPYAYDEPMGVHSLVPTLFGWLAASEQVAGVYSGDGSSTLIGPGDPHRLFGPDALPDWPADHCIDADTLQIQRARRGAALRYTEDTELAALLNFAYVLPAGHYRSLDRLLPAANRLQHASNLIHHGEQAPSAADRMFPRVDKAAHWCRSSALYPFTDNALLDFALRLPARFKYRDGENKYLFKQVVREVVGADIMNNPKMGFESPNWQWLNSSCRTLLDDYLCENKLADHGLFNIGEVNRLRQTLTHSADLALQKRSASRLRQLLYVQLWIEHWQRYGLRT